MADDYEKYLKELKEEEELGEEFKKTTPSSYHKFILGIVSAVAVCIMSTLLVWVSLQVYTCHSRKLESGLG